MSWVTRIMRGALVTLAAAIVLQAGVVVALAQQRSGGARFREGGPPPDPTEIRQAMERVMISRLKEVLELTPNQEARVMPRLRELLEERHLYASRRRTKMAYLRAAMMDEEAEEAAIADALSEVREVERGFRQREDGLRDAIGEALTPRQQAKLLFFERRFRKMMQRRVRDLMRQRGGERGERGSHGRPGQRGAQDPFWGDESLSDPDDWGEE